MIHTETGDTKGKKYSPVSHEVQSTPLCFLYPFRSLGAARSNLSLKLGQWFMSNRIIYTKYTIIRIE